MKKFAILSIIAAFSAAMVACNGKTELAWTNSSQSDGKINNIVWASGDAEWTNGYDKTTTTESKEVSTTKGSITGIQVDNGAGLVAGTASDESGNSSFSLSEGSANTYTIKVIAGSASKLK